MAEVYVDNEARSDAMDGSKHKLSKKYDARTEKFLGLGFPVPKMKQEISKLNFLMAHGYATYLTRYLS